jgi:thiol-disulfide isomerase/thioredoxin
MTMLSGWRRAVVVAFTLAALLSGGLYYFVMLRSGLDSVAAVMPALPASIAANIFVQPDYQKIPIATTDYVVPGHYTLVIFHQPSCPDCRRLDQSLVDFQRRRKDVAVRKIDLGEKWSVHSTLRDFGRRIWWTPFVLIYGPDGELLRSDDAGKRAAWTLLNKWIKHESVKGVQQWHA